jgi:hypothetical protein
MWIMATCMEVCILHDQRRSGTDNLQIAKTFCAVALGFDIGLVRKSAKQAFRLMIKSFRGDHKTYHSMLANL